MAITGPGRGDSTTLAGHLSRRRKTSNRNQVAAGTSPDLLEGRKPKEKPGLRASPHERCHRRRRTVAHAACATHKTDCSRTYDTMAVQLSLKRCGVVLDRSRGGTAPSSQPQRSPTSATDCDSDPSGSWMGRVGRMVNKHSRSSSGMRKESDLKRWNYNTS